MNLSTNTRSRGSRVGSIEYCSTWNAWATETMINCARMNAIIRVLKNSQALRPILLQFSFKEVSTIAYDSCLAGVSQFTPGTTALRSVVEVTLLPTPLSSTKGPRNQGTRQTSGHHLLVPWSRGPLVPAVSKRAGGGGRCPAAQSSCPAIRSSPERGTRPARG